MLDLAHVQGVYSSSTAGAVFRDTPVLRWRIVAMTEDIQHDSVGIVVHLYIVSPI